MWHENAEEMGEMLKSIFRMDEDSMARHEILDLEPRTLIFKV
jgi:hypothetical protein